MAEIEKLPVEQNISVTAGVDLTITVPVTLDGVAFVWSGSTIDTGIYAQGSTTAHATDWTETHAVNGSLVLSLTAANTTALGAGTFRYYATVTKSSVTYPVVAGQLSIRGITEAA